MEWKNEFGEIEKLLTRSSFEKVAKNAKDTRSTQSRSTESPALKGTPFNKGGKVAKNAKETRSTQSKKTPASSGQVRLLLLCSNAKKNIRDVAFGTRKAKHRIAYIRRHQHALVRMMDCVFELTAEKEERRGSQSRSAMTTPVSKADTPASGGHSPAPAGVYALLEDLHEFLRKEYADCFNARAFVPKGYMMKVREEFKIDFNDLLTVLVREKVPANLLHVIVHPYRSIIQGKEVKWSYEKVEWMRRFLRVVGKEEKVAKGAKDTQRTRRRFTESPGLNDLRSKPTVSPSKGGHRRIYTSLVRKLIYHDFNSSGFKSWLIEAIYEDVDKKDGIFQRMERLSGHLTELSKLPVKEGNKYTSTSGSVKEEVCAYIESELKRKKELYWLDGESPASTPVSKADTPASGGQSPEEGIHFGLSVEELGLFIAAMKLVGMIKNEHLNKVAAFLAKHCRTIGKENFSATYLCNSFGTKDRKSIERLYSKLMDVLNLLGKWKQG